MGDRLCQLDIGVIGHNDPNCFWCCQMLQRISTYCDILILLTFAACLIIIDNR